MEQYFNNKKKLSKLFQENFVKNANFIKTKEILVICRGY